MTVLFSSEGYNGKYTCRRVKFFDNLICGPANSIIPISKIEYFIGILHEIFMKRGFETSKLTELIQSSLIGVCPVCNDWSTPTELIAVWCYIFGNIKIYDKTERINRLTNNVCMNKVCNSDKIQLFWCIDLDIDAQIYLKNRNKNIELKDGSIRKNLLRYHLKREDVANIGMYHLLTKKPGWI